MTCETCEHKEIEIMRAMKLLRAWADGNGDKPATEYFLDYLVGQPVFSVVKEGDGC